MRPVLATVDPAVPASAEIDRFLAYSRTFYEARHYTNDGPVVKQLERRLAELHGTRHCIAHANGFWALVLTIQCLALPGREQVVLPTSADPGLADAVAWCGLTVRPCEVDADTGAMAAGPTASAIDAHTALVIAVQAPVIGCDVVGLERLAAERGVPLLLDGGAFGLASRAGRSIGAFGQAGCFSMQSGALVDAFEGGYVTTDDDALARRLAKMRGFGYFGQDNIEHLGLNAKLNEVHAAMALASLDNLEARIAANLARYRFCQHQLAGIDGLRLLAHDETERCGFEALVLELETAWPWGRARTVALMERTGLRIQPTRSADRFIDIFPSHGRDEASLAALGRALRRVSGSSVEPTVATAS